MLDTSSTDAARARHPTLGGEPVRAWLLLAMGVCAVSAQSASSLAFAVLMKPMIYAWSIDRTAFAWAMSTRMLLMVAAMSVAGVATDRFGARAVLAAGAAAVGSCTIGLALMTSSTCFYPTMALIGPGQALIGSVAASALIVRHFSQRRGLAVGILNGGDNLLNAAIPIVTAIILQRHGWRTALVALGAGYLVLALIIRSLLRPEDGRHDQLAGAEGTATDVLHAPWRAFLLIVATYVGVYAFVTSVQLHLHAHLTDIGFPATRASQILSTQLLVGALGAPLVGVLASRWGARSTLLVTVAGLTVASLLLWNLESSTALFAWAIFYGLVNSGIVALLALLLTELFGPARIGQWFGISMMFCMGSTMLANVYSAAMFDRFGSYTLVWQSYTALMLVILLPVARLAREHQPRFPGSNSTNPYSPS